MFKFTTDKADTAFSLYIRYRDKWTCRRCRKVHEVGSKGLTNSHYWGRGRENTRFDPENCDSLCWLPCHVQWEKEDRDLYKEFKIKQLGQNGFDALMIRAHQTKRKDRAMQLLIANKLLELEKKIYGQHA